MSTDVTTKPFAIEKNVYKKYIFCYTLLRYIYVIIPCFILILLGIILKIKYLYICPSIFLILFVFYFLLKIYIITHSRIGNNIFNKYSYQIKQNSLYIINDQKYFMTIKNDKSLVLKQYKNRYIFIINNWFMFYIDEKKFSSPIEFQIFESFVKNHFSTSEKNKKV